MSETNVSVHSGNPHDLELELAVGAIDQAGSALRVNGTRLQALVADDGSTDHAWLLSDRDDGWSVVTRAADQWQVHDIFWCLDHADLVTRITSPTVADWTEVLVVPVSQHWIVIHADPTGARELHLHTDPSGHSLWRTRSAAHAAAAGWAASVSDTVTPEAAQG